MFKKALVASAILAATSGVAFANGGSVVMPAEPTHVCICYVGAGINGEFVKFQNRLNTVTTGIDSATFGGVTGTFTSLNTFTQNWDAGGQGVSGELYLGTGWYWSDRYYFGGEIFGQVTNAKAQHQVFETAATASTFTPPVIAGSASFANAGFEVEYKLRNKWGIQALLGTKISDSTMVYVLGGYVNGGFRLSESAFANSSSGVFVNTDLTNGSFSQSKRKGGWRAGVGMDTRVSQNVSVRLQYAYNQFSRFNRSLNSGNFTVPGDTTVFNATANASTRATVQEVMVGLNYFFNAA